MKKKELEQIIAELDRKIKIKKKRQTLDKKSFAKQITFAMLMFPAFLMGWKGGKLIRGKPFSKKIVRQVVLILLKFLYRF